MSKRQERISEQRIKFNFDWKFIHGDLVDAEKVNFDDSTWQNVSIPHDGCIELPIGKTNLFTSEYEFEHEKDGKTERNGFFSLGVSWYRKLFNLPRDCKGKKIFVEFEGIFRNSAVWVNGHFLGNHKSGYTSFMYDLTDYVNFDKPNTLAVRVDARKKEGWWYEGGGIYRSVRLLINNNLHMDYCGQVITTVETSPRKAVVNIKTQVKNENEEDKNCILAVQILDPDNKLAGVAEAKRHISGKGSYEFNQNIIVKNPRMWSPDDPCLYKVVSRIKGDNNVELDSYENTLGIRTFCFDKDKGFFLNGKHLKLRGMCGHQDCGPLGVALPDRVHFEMMKLLKECGCNFYRASHNPPAPALLDACDRLGIMVWDENRHLDDSETGVSDLVSMIRRDRNHPCVVIWGLENEDYREGTMEGTRILKNLAAIARAEDPTRPTTFAACNNVNPFGYGDAVDVASYNYYLDRVDDDHQRYPKRNIGLISEYSCGAAVPFAYQNSRDKRMEKFVYELGTMYDACRGIEICWAAIEERKWLAGGCLWNAFDYLGESAGWPMIATQFGILDLCRLPKDNYYYYQSAWTDEPMVHILPAHWNWKEGETIRGWVYTNCESIELFLNNRSLGEKEKRTAKVHGVIKNLAMSPYHEEPVSEAHISWEIPFKPGLLKAVGKRNGKIVCSKEIRTAGAASKILLTPLWDNISADGQDVCFVKATVVDDNNTLFPEADHLVVFHAEGQGEIAGVVNADAFSHEKFKSNQRKCFNGVCLVAVRSTMNPGKIKLTADACGLIPGEIILQTNRSDER